ncbi:MAG TPA: fasciclin domain-containing protein [Planctomycetota bacterium]|nr:fasciclin domain-containing protein [Planctomycetota bacterium]
MMQKFILGSAVFVALAVAGSMLVAAQQKSDVRMDNGPSVMSVLKDSGRFKILMMALEDTDVAALLERPEPLTFFAPSDEAFQKVPKLAELLHDRERLGEVLRNHMIVGERLAYAELASRKTLTMYGGKVVDVRSDGRNVNDAKIEPADISAGTAVIHGIDKVLMENNDSKLRQAGETLEEGVKFAGRKVYDGLKSGAQKVKETFSDDDEVEVKTEQESTTKE